MLNLEGLLDEFSIGDELAVFLPDDGAEAFCPDSDLIFLVAKSDEADIRNYLFDVRH